MSVLTSTAVEGTLLETGFGQDGRRRVVIESVTLEADVFADGHDAILAAILYRHESASQWQEVPMQPMVNDRWFGEFRVSQLGRYHYTILGWVDRFETWGAIC